MPEPVAVECISAPSACCSTTSSHGNVIPELRPRCLLPKRSPRAAASLAFLKRIDHVEINSVEEFRGVTYYVIDVFLTHSTSRIPTNVPTTSPTKYLHSTRHKKHKLQSQKRPEPDFKVVRRFSSFDELRDEILVFCTQEPINVCTYCDRFRLFLHHCYSHPRTFVKYCAGRSLRRQVLSEFLNRAIALAVGLEASGRRHQGCLLCVGYEVIPTLIDQFLRRDMSVIERTQMLV
uniref:PX domain-containing protein n=1 Tax=Globisporangium ultimum (strain ATCC 200006 / CBS 805.95 / DAOM BR144) TaxID=431595 RepID=K3X9R6_GLOUD